MILTHYNAAGGKLNVGKTILPSCKILTHLPTWIDHHGNN